VLAFARGAGIPPVATAGVHFAEASDRRFHVLLRAIALNTKFSRLPESELAPESAWLQPTEDMAPDCFPASPTRSTTRRRSPRRAVSDRIFSLALPEGFDGMTAEETLRTLRAECLEGLRRRTGAVRSGIAETARVRARHHRPEGIRPHFSDRQGHRPSRSAHVRPGVGRGEPGVVQPRITQVDPIRHNLFFERFLNPGRKDPPDIDVDFPWDERDGVLEYVFQKYGPERSAMVANHAGFQLRAAVREVSKVYGLPDPEIKRVTDRLSHLWFWARIRWKT